MVVGDGRKYLTCLITLKVVNMIMSVKNRLWTIVDVSLKIHHRWLRTQRLWLQQNSLTQEQLAGFRVLAVRSLLIKNIQDPLLKWQTNLAATESALLSEKFLQNQKVHTFESFWMLQIIVRLLSFVELCQERSSAVKLAFFFFFRWSYPRMDSLPRQVQINTLHETRRKPEVDYFCVTWLHDIIPPVCRSYSQAHSGRWLRMPSRSTNVIVGIEIHLVCRQG